MKKQPWFEEWFNTEYYHLLYRKRDDKEASAFIHRIIGMLQLPAGAKVADIACGKGRHSRVLAGAGFHVTGFDLSENNIEYARNHASGNEMFTVHDMRLPYPDRNFDAAFNLFTSFGYFDKREDDSDALSNIYTMLKPAGYFVQDYLNGEAALGRLPETTHESSGGCDFDIHKSWIAPFIVKRIRVKNNRSEHTYEEKVKVYSMQELKQMHEQCGFDVKQVLGNYSLQPFEPGLSSRLIIISQKPL